MRTILIIDPPPSRVVAHILGRHLRELRNISTGAPIQEQAEIRAEGERASHRAECQVKMLYRISFILFTTNS